MLQERLYIIDQAGPRWRVRLSSVDRPLSVHETLDHAVEAAKNTARRWAPARIRVRHSGHPVTEWYIRYPDGEWQESSQSGPPPAPGGGLFGDASSNRP